MSGGNDSDVVIGDAGRVERDGDLMPTRIITYDNVSGDDDLQGDGATDYLLGGSGNDTIHGGSENDILLGDNGEILPDFVDGLAFTITTISATIGGADTLYGDAGDDLIYGQAGGDTISGDTGNDTIFGDRGTITIQAGVVLRIETLDTSVGGNDTVNGGEGADTIMGGAGDDHLMGDGGNDVVLGDHGVSIRNDGSALANDVYTSDPTQGGNDTVEGGDDADLLFGGPGNDSFTSGSGDDILIGDSGYVPRNSSDAPESARTTDPDKGGADSMEAMAGSNVILAGVGNDTVTAGPGHDVILGDNGVVGLGDTSLGTDSHNVMTSDYAQAGADTIDAGDGNNIVLAGSAGDLSVTAGSGWDIILGDNGKVVRTAAFVPTQIQSLLDDTNGGDDLHIDGGAGNDTIFGGAGDDTIFGNTGNDTIVGDSGEAVPSEVYSIDVAFGGKDTIDAGAGDDAVIGGMDGEYSILGGDGNDRILGDNGRILRTGTGFEDPGLITQTIAENPQSGGNEALIDGGGDDDVIVAGSAKDKVLGSAGRDVILGDNGTVYTDATGVLEIVSTYTAYGDSDSLLDGGTGNDVILGGIRHDIITGGTGNDVILGDNGRVVTGEEIQSTAPELAGQDSIAGGDGDDIIIGGSQGDTPITGGAGNDVILGDNGWVERDNFVVMGMVSGVYWNGSALAQTSALGDSDTSIDAGDGNDVVIGGKGNETIHGGAGNDVILGDNGTVGRGFAWPAADAYYDITTSYDEHNGVDTVSGEAGDDIILGGSLGDALLSGGTEKDIILGDNGVIQRSAALVVLRIESQENDLLGGDETRIDGGYHDDIILGGIGSDVLITGGLGNDVILGDNGVVVRADGTGEANDIWSIDPSHGGEDTIRGNDGDDIIIGGSENDYALEAPGTVGDRLSGDKGADIILGDNAYITRGAGDVVERIVTRSSVAGVNYPRYGGNDVIDANDGGSQPDENRGTDIILGGTGDDIIHGGWDESADVILGDNGVVVRTDPAPGADDDNDIWTKDPQYGGQDTIKGGPGADIILGGTGYADAYGIGGDTIHSGLGNDHVFGDGGTVYRDAQDRILKIETRVADASYGGDDIIDKDGDNNGNDVIIAGAGHDIIQGGLLDDGADIIFGDNGVVDYTTVHPVTVEMHLPNEINLTANITSSEAAYGGSDQIDGGYGNDIIIGGGENDDITGYHGLDIIIGDHGAVEHSSLNLVSMIWTVFPESGADDTITGGVGHDVIFGGTGNDHIQGDEGDEVIFGDNGVVVRFRETARDNDIYSTYPTYGGTDTIFGGLGNDIILGGSGGQDQATDQVPQGTVTVDEDGYLTREGGLAVRGDIIYGDVADSSIDGNDEVLFGDSGYVQRNLEGVILEVKTRSYIAELDGDTYVDYPNLGGNDAIDYAVGNKGAEIIMGGYGHDLIQGGLFDISTDIILGDNGVTTRINGQFILAGTYSTDPGSGGQDDINGGPGHDILLGGPGDDWIIGHDGDDYIYGDGGSDVLWGGVSGTSEGNFRLADGETASDKFDYAPGFFEAEQDYPTGYEPPLITPKVFFGLSWDGHVTDGADVLRGGYGTDWLFGGGDADDMDGGPGNDYVDGGVGNDVATGGGGDDVVRGGANDDSLRGRFWFHRTATIRVF